MKDKQKRPVLVAFHGLDERSQKAMESFLNGPCKAIKTKVVEESKAEIDIVDADVIDSKQLLRKCLKRQPRRPIILLSSEIINLNQDDKIIFLKKPLVSASMLKALQQAHDFVNVNLQQIDTAPPSSDALAETLPATYDALYNKHTEKVFTVPPASQEQWIPPKHSANKLIDSAETQKTAKHHPPLQLDEKDFATYIGTIHDAPASDAIQELQTAYNSKDYFQGYVQAAYKSAYGQKRVLKLNSGWKPLIILPQSNEVWIDVDDQQLRAFAAIKVDSSDIDVSSVDAHSLSGRIDNTKIQEIDAFLWKLAIWTSKGRHPVSIDIHSPVYLRRWPNFTRYLITPHALRIAALLIEKGPQTLLNVATLLNVELRFVYVFISAAYALGLAGQARRQVDLLITPELPNKTHENKGFLDKFISKLRGG